jgi:hypothetical protein
MSILSFILLILGILIYRISIPVIIDRIGS